jgi:hypothetical protein
MILNADDATQDHIMFIEMTERYLTREKYDGVRHFGCVHRGDLQSGSWIKRADLALAFAFMVCHAYVDQRPAVTLSFIEDKEMRC